MLESNKEPGLPYIRAYTVVIELCSATVAQGSKQHNWKYHKIVNNPGERKQLGRNNWADNLAHFQCLCYGLYFAVLPLNDAKYKTHKGAFKSKWEACKQIYNN